VARYSTGALKAVAAINDLPLYPLSNGTVGQGELGIGLRRPPPSLARQVAGLFLQVVSLKSTDAA